MIRRHPWRAAVLTIATLGLYGLYWFYTTSEHLERRSDQSGHPVLWLTGLLIPLVNLVVLWRFAAVFSEVTNGDGPTAFALLVLLFPAGQYAVQRRINESLGEAHVLAP